MTDAMEAMRGHVQLSHVRILRLRCKRGAGPSWTGTRRIETALWRGDENLVEFICGRPRAGHWVDMSEEAMNSKPMEIVKDFDDDEL